MWRIRLTDGGVVCAVLALFLARSDASPVTPPSVTTADELVRRALQAEVDGRGELTTKLLEGTALASPSHPGSHWYRGEVRVGDAWMAVDKVEQQAAHNPTLASYARLRDASPDSATAHFAMAAFCRKNDLPDRERWHWANVLRFQPGNKDAIRALGLRKYGNQWLTQREIEEREQLSREQNEAQQKWQPIVERLRKSLENSDAEQHGPALAELRALDDVAAIPFLEAGFSDADEWIQREAVGTLGKMRDPAATYALLRTSVLAPSESVRDAAADQLKPRPVFSYIPILMGSLETPVEYSYYFVVYATGTGQAFVSHVTLFRQGPLVAGGTEFGATRGHVFWHVGDGWRMAKELLAGDQLHSLSGAVPIDSIGDETTSTTHNLIVQDFATYFVGQPRLLTHDITARQVTSAIVPGLLTE